MVIKSVNLETVCGITSRLPHHTWPEIAFAGKSNVGKSTLINGLMQRRNYAHVSSTPGKTQTINYYNINDQLYFVDLPGYGYARTGRQVKEQWGPMIENYLHTSGSLKAVFLLVDCRHEPSENDIMMFDWIVHAGFVPVIIGTKADKLKKTRLAAAREMISDTLTQNSAYGKEVSLKVILYSGMTRTGRDEIMETIDDILQHHR